jgi:predicted RNase H-like HicB family nuclease
MAETEIIFSVQESPEGGYEARALGFSIYTQADTLDELKAMVQDAVRCHFEPKSAPRVIRLHLVKDEVIPA